MKYSSYSAYIQSGEDAPSAMRLGDEMKLQFPGADYELVEGDPYGVCNQVVGPDLRICSSIQEWINARR